MTSSNTKNYTTFIQQTKKNTYLNHIMCTVSMLSRCSLRYAQCRMILCILCLAVSVACRQLPVLANIGGPPDFTGGFIGENTVGIAKVSGYVSTSYLGNGEFAQTTARFMTWECTGKKGEFRATNIARTVFSNGTVLVQESCDVGLVEDTGLIRYAAGGTQGECPGGVSPRNATVTAAVLPADEFPLVPPPDYRNLTCDVDSNVQGMDTSKGPGLNPNSTLGVSSRNSSIPPPESTIVPAPPVFSVQGGIDDIHGVWKSSNKGIIRINAEDGFSALMYSNASDSFFLYLSKYNSHDRNDTGETWISVSETVSYENETLYIKPGCGIIFFNSSTSTDGTVDPYGIATVVNKGFGCNETYPESSWIVTQRVERYVPGVEESVGDNPTRVNAGEHMTPYAVAILLWLVVLYF